MAVRLGSLTPVEVAVVVEMTAWLVVATVVQVLLFSRLTLWLRFHSQVSQKQTQSLAVKKFLPLLLLTLERR